MKFVVIGASAAGINVVKKLRELNPKDEIVLISKDTKIYSRCILHHYLEGSRTLEELNFAGFSFEKELNIQWLQGLSATSIDTEHNMIILDDGNQIGYDSLCICTGSHTNFPPVPGLREGKNVVGFRSLSDVEEIKKRLHHVENIFVMGAGLVGIDVITGLLAYDKNIYLADTGPYMLPTQLDEYSAKVYQDVFAANGVRQFYKMGAKEFVLDKNRDCYKVILQDETEILIDLVINCAGVRSSVEFLSNSGIECDKFGLVIDQYGKTNIKNVFGAGDVTGKSLVWPTAVREGITAAYSMSGIHKISEDYFSLKSSMNFLDIPTLVIGNVNQCDSTYVEKTYIDENGNYKKLVSQNGVMAGALLQGNLENSGMLADCIRLNNLLLYMK